MVRFLKAPFLWPHGLVHGIMFSLPFSDQASADLPYHPSHSWLIGDTRWFGLAFAFVVAAAFVVAGAGYLGHADWWPISTLVAAGLSVLLLSVYFTKWWSVGILISVAFAVAASRTMQAAWLDS